MPALRIIPATPDLVRFIAARFSPDQLAVLHQVGEEPMLRHLEADVRTASRTWCAVDAGGPVFIVGAMEQPDGSGAHLWYLTATAAADHPRDCIRLWRRAVAETLAEFGTVRTDVPPYVAAARRMQRYGFTVAAPALDSGGTAVCRCVVEQGQAHRDVSPRPAPQMAS